MVNSTSCFRPSTWLTLLCVCVVMLAWATPLLTGILPGSLEDWSMNPGQEATDPADSPSSLWDATDEPVLLASIGGTAVPRLMFSFQPAQPTVWAWFPLLPIRPPIVVNSI